MDLGPPTPRRSVPLRTLHNHTPTRVTIEHRAQVGVVLVVVVGACILFGLAANKPSSETVLVRAAHYTKVGQPCSTMLLFIVSVLRHSEYQNAALSLSCRHAMNVQAEVQTPSLQAERWVRTVKHAMHAPLLRPGWLSDLPRDPEFNAHVGRPARQAAQVAGDEPSPSGQDHDGLGGGPETQAVEAAERADVTTPEQAQQEAHPAQRQPAPPRPNTWSSMRRLPNLHESLEWQ